MPAETPQGVPESVMFQGFSGLKNIVDRERLGPRDLALGVNIDLDDEGQPHRRRGYSQVASGNFHSLFAATNGVVYGVKDGDLGIVEDDYYFNVLQANILGTHTAGDPNISYWQIGDDIHFTHPDCSGIIKSSTGVVSPWGPSQSFWYSPVVDPSGTLPAIAGKLYGGPPRASALAYYNGRFYLAADKMLWVTVPYLYSLVDKTRGFIQFEDTITMVAVVGDGLYVGTDEGIWFLGGGSFEKLQRRRVMDSPAIPGSLVYIPSELANPPQIGPSYRPNPSMEVSVAFMTTRGFCVGEDGGRCTNLTEASFFFPVARRATGFFRRQDGMNHYICCMQTDGPPVNGARSGDFVDPALKRGNAIWVDVSDTVKAVEKYV